MSRCKPYVSRGYWNNYIESIIDSIREDKDNIIDMLMYGKMENAEITMNLSAESIPSYQIKIIKIAEKSPFGEEDDE